MMLFGAKLVAPILFVVALLGFGLGYLHWNTAGYKCFQKKYYSQGEWHTFFAAGKLELRYRTVNYDCDPEWKLDPAQYQKNDVGQIVPKLTE